MHANVFLENSLLVGSRERAGLLGLAAWMKLLNKVQEVV